LVEKNIHHIDDMIMSLCFSMFSHHHQILRRIRTLYLMFLLFQYHHQKCMHASIGEKEDGVVLRNGCYVIGQKDAFAPTFLCYRFYAQIIYELLQHNSLDNMMHTEKRWSLTAVFLLYQSERPHVDLFGTWSKTGPK
ncbi:hypothetical protein ACJX0J_010264, partial [Zea mays]